MAKLKFAPFRFQNSDGYKGVITPKFVIASVHETSAPNGELTSDYYNLMDESGKILRESLGEEELIRFLAEHIRGQIPQSSHS